MTLGIVIGFFAGYVIRGLMVISAADRIKSLLSAINCTTQSDKMIIEEAKKEADRISDGCI